jgi:nucleotide-binding universal stress UspA family protein
MLPLKRILVPTDFSEASYSAFGAAGELAEQYRAVIVLLHVIPPIPVFAYDVPALDVSVYSRTLHDAAVGHLHALISRNFPPGVTVEPRVVLGDPARTIVKSAHDEGADMVVISTHGETGWRHTLFGSVTEKVVRLADRPVLVIQAEQEEEGRGERS